MAITKNYGELSFLCTELLPVRFTYVYVICMKFQTDTSNNLSYSSDKNVGQTDGQRLLPSHPSYFQQRIINNISSYMYVPATSMWGLFWNILPGKFGITWNMFNIR